VSNYYNLKCTQDTGDYVIFDLRFYRVIGEIRD